MDNKNCYVNICSERKIFESISSSLSFNNTINRGHKKQK